ncbi:hypothetical protein [Rubritalea tangerina]
MFLMIAGMVLVFGHVWGIKKYLETYREKEGQAMSLAVRAESYRNSVTTADVIAEEVAWMDQYEPEPSTFGAEQSKLLEFLTSSGKKLGFTPEKPQLSPLDNKGGKYQRTKIQMTATATEEQIYQWLVEIHQPSEFRAVTQILMRPSPKAEEDETIICTLTAEQWLIASESL